jgi:hypothetical protein
MEAWRINMVCSMEDFRADVQNGFFNTKFQGERLANFFLMVYFQYGIYYGLWNGLSEKGD